MSTPHIIPDEELTVIAERLRNASTKPWRVESDPEHMGDNWFLFSCGNSGIDGKDYYVTTDHVHTSEYDGDAKTDAEFIVWCRNDMARLGNAYVALRGVYGDLLAAAPDLLVLAEELIPYLDLVSTERANNARAIVAKAKGETP